MHEGASVYNYDRRRLASASQLLHLIVQKVRDERAVSFLIAALVDELKEDWEDTHGPLPSFDRAQLEAWEERQLGILHDAKRAEQLFQKIYVEAYLHAVPWADRQNAMEVMEYPDRMPLTDIQPP